MQSQSRRINKKNVCHQNKETPKYVSQLYTLILKSSYFIDCLFIAYSFINCLYACLFFSKKIIKKSIHITNLKMINACCWYQHCTQILSWGGKDDCFVEICECFKKSHELTITYIKKTQLGVFIVTLNKGILLIF